MHSDLQLKNQPPIYLRPNLAFLYNIFSTMWKALGTKSLMRRFSKIIPWTDFMLFPETEMITLNYSGNLFAAQIKPPVQYFEPAATFS